MKQFRSTAALAAAASVLLTAGQEEAQAQTGTQLDPVLQRKGEVLRTQTQPGSLSGSKVTRTELPESMPQAIKDRLLQFERKREEYLAQQLELIHQLNKASDKDREQLREQLREQRQAWLDEAKKIREQARARLQEIKRELVNHGEVIEAAREQARDQVRDQIQEQKRERRGTD